MHAARPGRHAGPARPESRGESHEHDDCLEHGAAPLLARLAGEPNAGTRKAPRRPACIQLGGVTDARVRAERYADLVEAVRESSCTAVPSWAAAQSDEGDADEGRRRR